ncbi:MAG: prolyl oligopeptidase family serine peptidase [Planctomycetota bacterium]|nr:prolyl oligopeptidase family serine peptidase [Planctomycetota bacterium]
MPGLWIRVALAFAVPAVAASVLLAKELPMPGDVFKVTGGEAFLIAPKPAPGQAAMPWVWYAPTLPGLPGPEEKWMIQKFLDAGVALAGVDVGESYGSPKGRAAYTAFYEEMTAKRGMAKKPCLLARSRGGLMLYNWAAEHPDCLSGVAGIYPVCDLASWPGLATACGAFDLSEAQLHARLTEHNPIDRLAPLAKARVPIFHIHGDGDTVVPLEKNSRELAKRYRQLGGAMTLLVMPGRGHDMWTGWFQCQELVDFAIARAKDAPPHQPERIALWGGRAPVGEGQFQPGANAFVTVHRPAKANGAVVVICPGGGYGVLVTEPEGHGIARWLNGHGVIGVVLEYRLPGGRSAVPLLDAQRALRLARSRAGQWGGDPARVGIMGFSAGGHLASTAATHFDAGAPAAADPLDRTSCRPDFAVLVYPVISMGPKTHQGSKDNLLGPAPKPQAVDLFSNEKQVTAQTPPAFLAHAKDDTLVSPDNSLLFFRALQAHKVPAKYLELPSGGHGLNGYAGPSWDAWQRQSLQWLASLHLLPPSDAP